MASAACATSTPRRRAGGDRRRRARRPACTPRSASASARSSATRSARSSARSSTSSCSRTCVGLIPGVDDVAAQLRPRRVSTAASGDRHRRHDTDLLGQLPGGLLLAGYVARLRRRRDPADAASATSPPDAPAPRHRPPTRSVAADLVIAVDIAEIGEADYSLDDLHDEWNELGFDLARDAVVVEDDAGTRSATRTSAAATCSPSSTRAREGEGAGTALLDGPSSAAASAARARCARRVGDRGDDRAGAAGGRTAATPVAQLLADGARRRPRRDRGAEPACAA